MVTIVVASILLGQGSAKKSQPKKNINPLSIQLENKQYRLGKPMEILHPGTVLDGHGATLVGNGSGVGLHIGAFANVTVKNLKFSGFDTAISIDGASSLTMSGITINGNSKPDSVAVRIQKSTNSSLQGINCYKFGAGIALEGCSKISIEKSDISHNISRGVLLKSSTACLVRDNRIVGTGESVGANAKSCGIELEEGSAHNQILRNAVVQGKGIGIGLGLENSLGILDNGFESNDVSWTSGDGFQIRTQTMEDKSTSTENQLISNVAAHCLIGIHLINASSLTIKGNLIVGNNQAGVLDDHGARNNYDSNTFAMDTGSSTAAAFVSDLKSPAGTRLFQNVFVDYVKPLSIENTNPMTLQSNTYVRAGSDQIEDLADIVGPKPLALDNQVEKPKSGPFVTSVGMLAQMPSLVDRLCGVNVASMVKPDDEVVVEGSLTGSFLGEEEVLARYKGTIPIELTFPPRTVNFVRIKGVPQVPAAFLALMGDQSLCRGKDTEDSADTILLPNEAVDGDTISPDHGWHPATGKAGEWWQVDLKDPQTVTTLSILANTKDPNAFWTKFHIVTSLTGEFHGEETMVATETDWSKKPGPQRVYKISPTVCRYIRIVGDVDQAGVLLAQFQAYGISH